MAKFAWTLFLFALQPAFGCGSSQPTSEPSNSRFSTTASRKSVEPKTHTKVPSRETASRSESKIEETKVPCSNTKQLEGIINQYYARHEPSSAIDDSARLAAYLFVIKRVHEISSKALYCPTDEVMIAPIGALFSKAGLPPDLAPVIDSLDRASRFSEDELKVATSRSRYNQLVSDALSILEKHDWSQRNLSSAIDTLKEAFSDPATHPEDYTIAPIQNLGHVLSMIPRAF